MRLHRCLMVSAVLISGFAIGCSSNEQTPNSPGATPDDPNGNGSFGLPSDPAIDPDAPIAPMGPEDPNTLTCRPTIEVDPHSRALVVTDPEVLERFSLERVLQQIMLRLPSTMTPLELMQNLFETQNSSATAVFPNMLHCDDPGNLVGQSLVGSCPRAEGQLATSTGFFEPGHPDSFVPVALVNRFDLAPREGGNCGEHRIIYAKWSGRTNPKERVFLAFEGIIQNPTPPNTLVGCRPVATTWASLANETDLQVIADRLEKLYFTGLEGFKPVVSPEHYGLASETETDDGGGYGDKDGPPKAGQLRLSQGMQEPWEFREFHLHLALNSSLHPGVFFGPVRTKNNPRAELFDPATAIPDGVLLRQQILDELPTLAAKEVSGIQFSPRQPSWNSGRSQITANPAFDFTSRAFTGEPGQAFYAQMQSTMADLQIGKDCPPNDPLLPEHIIRRVSMLSCAGCHAPQQYLGPDNAIGCGQTWPNVPSRAHIDEFGKLSPALENSLLPRRAEVLSMYLQACDLEAIKQNLEPAEILFSDLP
jgi:hypothetical protein